MMEHVCEVFRSPIREMHITEESLIEWIIKFQPIIRHVCIRKDVILSVESLDRILKNLEVTESFRSDYHAYFQYKEPIPSRCITIYNSHWLTLTSILTGNNSIIFLYDSKLTPTDINTILKEWQMGFKLRNLEFMAIEVFTFLDIHRYSNEVLNSFPNSVENNGRPMTVKVHDDDIWTLPEGPPVHNIIRSDGMILSIFRHDDVIEVRANEMNKYGVWVAGIRKPECIGNSSCQGINALSFSDPFHSDNPTGYLWNPNQPDGTSNDCLVWIMNPDGSCGIDDVP
ncbi:hypothetical protein B9Z55_002883 [Caenorhabditis nigoni]|uniref:Sdz-33 F-box domain-containing protein n=1 Tax=Caenorhabditis nigoni TaxID=1611254 RepID=A0A2G5VMW0_9PELO|nr:hypothetical protein B9Z55_002883 [Caenorhabditis nigoni]